MGYGYMFIYNPNCKGDGKYDYYECDDSDCYLVVRCVDDELA